MNSVHGECQYERDTREPVVKVHLVVLLRVCWLGQLKDNIATCSYIWQLRGLPNSELFYSSEVIWVTCGRILWSGSSFSHCLTTLLLKCRDFLMNSHLFNDMVSATWDTRWLCSKTCRYLVIQTMTAVPMNFRTHKLLQFFCSEVKGLVGVTLNGI